MSDAAVQSRFEELDAARALGDLSAEESEEFAKLVETGGFEPDADFDWIVAALDAEREEAQAPGAIDGDLRARLIADAAAFGGGTTPAAVADVVPFWKHPLLGWSVAACVALALVYLQAFAPDGDGGGSSVSLAEAREALVQGDGSVQLAFAGTEGFPGLSGNVVWGDAQQEGYMELKGLPANDPSVSQYQLWIVDPARDSVPVDGGVFDIPAGDGAFIVPVRAALAVSQPAAFVITVEKPGGVVVSKQEIVAAIAQRAG